MYSELKKECCEANMQLSRLGLVIYTFGNVSCIDRNRGVYAIKPSGMNYEKMKWQDIVIVDLENNVADGRLRPSSDTETHTVLYREFPDIGGIVHTHSTNAAAWAQAGRSVPVYGTTHADHLAEPIPCTDFMPDDRIKNNYETETGLQIVDCFKAKKLNPDEVPMVLVAGHGPFTWGRDAASAVYHARVLEEICKMAFLTENINASVKPLKAALINKHYERKHGKNAYYGQI